MVIDGIDKQYKEYLKRKKSCWEFGDSILYRMCEEYPYHNDADEVVGKLWLIGRSYAAAIEQRKNADDFHGDDFYQEVVAPKFMEIGSELDDRIQRIKTSEGELCDTVSEVLSTHKFLMDVFTEITGLEKRSLASKYLHFHCPEKFFIYDSRARAAIRTIVRRPDKTILTKAINRDDDYGDFVCRMLELQRFLKDTLGIYELPRAMDGFLLTKVSQE